MDWEKFFKEHADYHVETYFYECRGHFTIEDLYQAFKERLAAELNAALAERGGDNDV